MGSQRSWIHFNFFGSMHLLNKSYPYWMDVLWLLDIASCDICSTTSRSRRGHKRIFPWNYVTILQQAESTALIFSWGQDWNISIDENPGVAEFAWFPMSGQHYDGRELRPRGVSQLLQSLVPFGRLPPPSSKANLPKEKRRDQWWWGRGGSEGKTGLTGTFGEIMYLESRYFEGSFCVFTSSNDLDNFIGWLWEGVGLGWAKTWATLG